MEKFRPFLGFAGILFIFGLAIFFLLQPGKIENLFKNSLAFSLRSLKGGDIGLSLQEKSDLKLEEEFFSPFSSPSPAASLRFSPVSLGSGVSPLMIQASPKRFENPSPSLFSPSLSPSPKPSENKKCARSIGAESAKQIIFNEIGWMGTGERSDNEWFELKNISAAGENLENWTILSDSGMEVRLGKTMLEANGFFVLERTSDDTLSFLKAGQIYKGALRDSGENIYLFDGKCVLQDEILSASGGWPAGEKTDRKTMERKSDFGWQTFLGAQENGVNGTPGKENSVSTALSINPSPTVSPSPSPMAIFSPSPSPTPTGGGGSEPTPTPKKVIISEIQIEGADSKDEFIELFNPNTEEVDLLGWILRKKTSSGSQSVLVSGEKFRGRIPAKSYFLIAPQDFALPLPNQVYSGKTYSIAGNNTVLLYDKYSNLIDKVGFGEAVDFETLAFPQNPEAGQSLSRKPSADSYPDSDNNSADFGLSIPTPKAQNQFLNSGSNALLPPVISSHIFGQLLNADSIILSGAAEPDADVIFEFKNATSSVNADEGGLWSKNFTLQEGENIFSLKTMDSSGNQSENLDFKLYLDSTPPSVEFVLMPNFSLSTEFEVSWEGEDLGYNTSPGNFPVFTLKFDSEKSLKREDTVADSWLDWNSGEDFETTATTVSVLAEDFQSIEFQLKAGDQAGNESSWQSFKTEVNQRPVFISEIAWMGTTSSSNAEWIELGSLLDADLDFGEDWVLRADDGSPSIELDGLIAKNGFFLLERTDDETLSDVPADQIYTGALENNGENLKLLYKNQIIDQADCEESWYAGDNGAKNTMERIDSAKSGNDSGNWKNSTNSGGTPKE